VVVEMVLVSVHHLVFQLLIDLNNIQEQIQLVGHKMVLLDLAAVAVVVITQNQVTKEEMADLELL
tara:strand:+ start:349 stop:543 length:195 start_codon:yes stop_codon:yes gene_type:complete